MFSKKNGKKREIRPDRQSKPVTVGWAGAKMRVYTLKLDHHGPTDGLTD